MRDDVELIRLARANHMLVGAEQLKAAGIGPARWQRWLDAGAWQQVSPARFRHAATELTFEMSVRAGAEWIGQRGALHGASALAWLGVDVEPPFAAEFLLPRSRRSIPNWVIVHTTSHWDDADVILHRGIRTTTATRALIDLAAVGVSAAQLEAAIDSAIRTRRTALTRLLPKVALVGGRGRAGTRLMRELLLDSGGESHLERRFLRLLRGEQIPRPECQVVFRAKGTHVARVDFRFPGTNVVVEVGGRLGHSSDSDRRRDARRRNALQRAGMTVLEFTTADVIDSPEYVLTTLRDWLPVAA